MNNQKREIPEILRGKTYLDPTYDPAFRAFFADAETLQDFLNSILHLEPGRQIKKLSFTFTDPLEFRVPEPNTVIFDIHAVTEDLRFLDIEMQRAKHSFFIDRVLLYSAYLAIKGKQQMEQSADFLQLDETERKRRRYAIPEIISIWICNFHPTENFEGYRDSWALYSENDLKKGKQVAVSEKLKYILVDLPNFSKEHHAVDSREDKWLYLLTHAGDATEVSWQGELSPWPSDDLLFKALERIRVSSANDELLSEQAKEMVTQDETDVRIADGIILGRAEGRAEGIAQGSLAKAKEMAKAMLLDGLSFNKISLYTGLSEEDIKNL